MISDCPSNIPATISPGETSAIVTWDEPAAVDDSTGAVDVTKSHTPGFLFPVGDTQVTYTFTDSSMNSASCFFTVSVSGKIILKNVIVTFSTATDARVNMKVMHECHQVTLDHGVFG